MLDALLSRITAPNPKPSRRRILAKPQPLLFLAGDLLSFPMQDGQTGNPYFSSWEEARLGQTVLARRSSWKRADHSNISPGIGCRCSAQAGATRPRSTIALNLNWLGPPMEPSARHTERGLQSNKSQGSRSDRVCCVCTNPTLGKYLKMQPFWTTAYPPEWRFPIQEELRLGKSSRAFGSARSSPDRWGTPEKRLQRVR